MSKKKPNKTPVLATSRDLIAVGPRQVQTKHQGKRDENGLKPSTSRALVLRNGKYGARGTGELMLAGKMSGREKLDLLAEDLVLQKSRTAIMAPLKLEKCIKIADSQYNAYLDDIANLKDPDLFYDKIIIELAARIPNDTSGSGSPELSRNPSYVASVVSTRIHNAYMVASGWKIILDILRHLEKSGLGDATAQTQLQRDENLRSRYLVLCDILGVLVDIGQMHFSITAMNTPHYSRYFKQAEHAQPGEPSIIFDWGGLKEACRSFLDSIIIELCFPGASYPRRILYHILHDAVEESPREAKRFPQSMWDAVGDLSVLLELQELLESPLLGPQGQKLKAFPRQMPEQYELWLDAQIYSKQASESYANFKDLISPLEKMKDCKLLDNMWKFINLNYKAASGLSIDSLWQLDDALHRTPQWSSLYMPSLRTHGFDSDDEDTSKRLVKSTGRKGNRNGGKRSQKKRLAITDGRVDDEDSAGSMPDLQSVSDTSDESGDEDMFVSDIEEDEDEDDSDYDDETDYESDEEEFYRTMLREAMDTAMAIPEFFDPQAAVPEFDVLAEERKGNPFLKLLGSLRGRMFASSPKLSTTTRTEPRKGAFPGKGQAAKAPPKPSAAPRTPTKAPAAPAGKVPAARPTPAASKEKTPAPTPSEEPKDYRATVEDAEDEEEAPSTTGKKKKKKKPKKKKKATDELPVVQEDVVPPVTPPPTKPQAALLPESPAKSPSKPSVAPASVKNPAQMSTASLPIGPTTAQSGRSYLQEQGEAKEKIKTRSNQPSLFSDKRGFLAKLSGKDKDKVKAKKEEEHDENINKKFTWFNKLGKKTAGYMHQLLHPSGEKVGHLRWESFVKVMLDMGFTYDPSTAGSSVRFDPPNPGDRSISVHRPHPGSTMDPYKIRHVGKTLKERYGWSEEDFLKRTALAESEHQL